MDLTPIRLEDRAPDQNLLPEAKERVYEEIRTYLARIGYVNYADIAKQLGTSRGTAKTLVDEVMKEMREEDVDDRIIRIQWLQAKVQLLEQNPEAFGVQNEIHRIAVQLALWNGIDKLRDPKIIKKEPEKDIMKYFDLTIWGDMKPKTRKLIEEHEALALGTISPSSEMETATPLLDSLSD